MSRILVIEDSAQSARAMVNLVQNMGFEASWSPDGDDALRRMRFFQPHLVLLDLLMPKMDGFEFLARVRNDPRWAGLPVVVMSGADDRSFRERTFVMGATAWLDKPVSAEQFDRIVLPLLAPRTLTRFR